MGLELQSPPVINLTPNVGTVTLGFITTATANDAVVAALAADSTSATRGALSATYATVFNVRKYGAVGDARKVTVSMTSGSATVTGTGFTAADTGKALIVAGAGAAGATLRTTATYVNATTLTAAANASTTVTSVESVIGTDDRAAVQAAIDAAYSANTVYFPKPLGPIGFSYLIGSPLTIPRAVTFEGAESTVNVWFSGSGYLFELGTDNGHAYDANDYDGVEGVTIRDLILRGVPGATALANGGGKYAPGSHGIRDWRGGGLTLDRVQVFNFDTWFWGIQSDLNTWHNVSVNSNHDGYLGPRSDQLRVTGASFFIYNDRALDIDGAHDATFFGTSFVDNGSSTTAPIRLRSQWARGCKGVKFHAWFEHLIGLTPLESFVEVGVGSTYAVEGVTFHEPLIVTNPVAGPVHCKYLVKTGNCNDIRIERPVAPNSLMGLEKFVYHVDTVATPTIVLGLAQSSTDATLQPIKQYLLGGGAASIVNTYMVKHESGQMVSWMSGDRNVAQVNVLPNGNFPQIWWRAGDGTSNWIQQCDVLAYRMLFRSQNAAGLWAIEDNSAVRRLEWSDTGGLKLEKTGGKIGAFGVTPVVQPTVTGSRGGNAALASLLTALASLGLVIDSSTA